MQSKSGIAIVTGAAQGIGRAMAAALGRRGYSLWLVDVREAALTRASEALLAKRIDATAVTCDLGDAAALSALAERAEQAKVEILVNNAKADLPLMPFWEQPQENVSRALAVNLAAPAELCRRLLPGMLERGHGAVINLGSQATRVPLAFIGPYAASKAALHALTRTLQQETFGSGVHVMLAEPGPVLTDGYRNAEQALFPRAGRTRKAVEPYAFAEAVMAALARRELHLAYPAFDKLAAVASLFVPGPMRRAMARDQLNRLAAQRSASRTGGQARTDLARSRR